MLVFIDESGDPGFKIGSSHHLIISLIIFDDYDEADRAREQMSILCHQLRIKPEFRFSKSTDATRQAFFELCQNFNFRIRCIVMQKHKIYSHYLQNHPAPFYNYTLRQLIAHSALVSAKIRIDGNAKREFQKEAQSYLRREAPIGAVANVKFVDSKKEPLIQLADMVTGAFGRSYANDILKQTDTWHSMLKNKIENIWIFE